MGSSDLEEVVDLPSEICRGCEIANSISDVDTVAKEKACHSSRAVFAEHMLIRKFRALRYKRSVETTQV